MALMLCSSAASAQGFLKKLKKAAETVTSVTETPTTETAGTAEAAADTAATDNMSVITQKLIANPVSFTAKKEYRLDDDGNIIKNADGTDMVFVTIYDQNGKACSKDAAKQMIKVRRKAAGKIVAKIGGGAAAGAGAALVGNLLGGKKKNRGRDVAIGAAAGAAAGLLASSGDIKKVKEQNKLLKKYEEVIEAYEKTFNEDGSPLSADVDMSAFDGCEMLEEPRKNSEVMAEMAASNEAASAETVDWDAAIGAV